MRTAIKVATLGLLVGTGSCLSTPPTDPSRETIAAIAGRVVRPDGTGVGGPIVAVQLMTAATGGSAQFISSASVLGADDGRFLFVFLVNGFTPQLGSATVSVTAPIGSGLAGRDTTGIPVKLVLGRLATDTSFVQMELRPR
jgi:hypothetical protein